MMTESEMIRFVRKIIRQEFASVAMSQVVTNASQLRTTFQRSTTTPPFANARNIQPYGVSSRAPANTPCLTIPVGNNPTNVNVVGVHDPLKPSLDDGETILYDAYGHVIYLSQGQVSLGSKTASHAVPLGDILKEALDNILTALLNETHEGNLGYPTGTPINSSDFQAVKSSPVDDGTLLSTVVFSE